MSEKSPIAKKRDAENQQVTIELLKRDSHRRKTDHAENQ